MQITTTTPTVAGGWMLPLDQLRPLVPDARWAVSAAGWVTVAGPAVVARLAYEKNDGTLVVLGESTLAASGKARIGPFALRGDLAPTVPQNEPIVSVVLTGHLAAAGTAATLVRWTVWLRMTPAAA